MIFLSILSVMNPYCGSSHLKSLKFKGSFPNDGVRFLRMNSILALVNTPLHYNVHSKAYKK